MQVIDETKTDGTSKCLMAPPIGQNCIILLMILTHEVVESQASHRWRILSVPIAGMTYSSSPI